MVLCSGSIVILWLLHYCREFRNFARSDHRTAEVAVFNAIVATLTIRNAIGRKKHTGSGRNRQRRITKFNSQRNEFIASRYAINFGVCKWRTHAQAAVDIVSHCFWLALPAPLSPTFFLCSLLSLGAIDAHNGRLTRAFFFTTHTHASHLRPNANNLMTHVLSIWELVHETHYAYSNACVLRNNASNDHWMSWTMMSIYGRMMSYFPIVSPRASLGSKKAKSSQLDKHAVDLINSDAWVVHALSFHNASNETQKNAQVAGHYDWKRERIVLNI